MKITTPRPLWKAAGRHATTGLETLETDLRPRRSRRSPAGILRAALLSLLTCATVGLATSAVRADDAAPAAPAPGTITVFGLVDWYYGLNFNRPGKSFAIPTTLGPITGAQNATRAFDYHNNFGFNLGEVNITRTPGKGFPLGVTATLTVGETPPIVYATDPHARRGFEGIQQLYLTYNGKMMNRDYSLDFGKMVTQFGNEVIESSSNDNYSRGLLFTLAIPFYHTGFRLAMPVTKTLTFTGMLVNGWNNSSDDNEAKSIHVGFTWKPNAKFTGILNFMGGSEGTGAYGPAVPTNGAGNITTNLFELLGTYQWNDKLKLVGDINYASAAGDVNGVHASGNWLGFAGYIHYQATPKAAVTVRLEQFEDMPGVGGVGLRTGSAVYTKLNEVTLTLEYAALRGHLINRLEFRHDHANQGFFLGNPAAGVPNQDTLFFSQVYKF